MTRVQATPDQVLAVYGGILGGVLVGALWGLLWVVTGRRAEWRKQRILRIAAQVEAVRRGGAA